MTTIERRMPAEWERHTATWMIYPPAVYDGSTALEDARAAWCEVARAVAQFEPVRMIVAPNDVDAARRDLGSSASFCILDVDDAWARDVAPTFVRESNGDVVAVDWRFNGWGAQSWSSWEFDAEVAGGVAHAIDMQIVRSEMVNEGGGIEVNGAGTVLLTQTVQLDPSRNPGWSREDVEAELRRTIGATRAVWFDRGLTGDYEEFGTRGHVDLLAKFIDERTVLFHDQRNPEHPDHAVSRVLESTLRHAGFNPVALRAPSRLKVGSRLCDWSYVNFSFVNGGAVLGTYGDEADDEALGVLREVLAGREIATVDARPLFALGGGVHCITQQQPG